jgi:16S rRNA (guanine966-N2)-methyltransferase
LIVDEILRNPPDRSRNNLRIIAGKWAGTDLVSPSGRVRPTAEDIRAAWLTALGPDIEKARVVDLFAGSGALGLEALSRGASFCDFVETSPSALHALKANVARLRLGGRTRIFKRDALAFVAGAVPRGEREFPYEIAFADPPYGSAQLDRLVELWLSKPFSRILTVEHSIEHGLPGPRRSRSFGETAVSIYESPSANRRGTGEEIDGG